MRRATLLLIAAAALGAANCRTSLPGASLSGRVVVVGEHELGGIVVTAIGAQVASASTDSDGNYQITGLVYGGYSLSASPRSTVEGSAGVFVAADGPVEAPDLRFSPAGRLHGRATRGGAAKGNAGIIITVEGTSAAAITDDAGDYQLDRVPTGKRELRAQAEGFRPGAAPGQSIAWDQLTEVPPIDLIIGPGHGTLRGTALLYAQDHHAGTTVTLMGTGLGTATADDGSWVLDDVPEGTYTLGFANGAYRETVPQVVALAGSDGFVIDESLYPLERSPLTLFAMKRIESTGVRTEYATYGGFLLSPDGQRVLYADSEKQSLKIAPLDGSGGMLLADGPLYDGVSPYGSTAFTPDGARVVFNANQRIEVVGSGGGPPQLLASGIEQFALSPVGSAVWYIGLDPVAGTEALFSVATAGGAPILLESDSNLIVAGWNAGGTRVLYRTDIDDYFRLGTVKLAAVGGGAAAVLGYGAFPPIMAPDLRYALVQTNVNTSDASATLISIELASGAVATLASGVSDYSGISFVGTDQVMYGVGKELFVSPLGGGPAVDAGTSFHFVVSGDGSHVAMASNCAQQTCGLAVATIGGTPRQIVDVATYFVLSKDGAQVLYFTGTDNSAIGPLWVASTSGGAPRQIDSNVTSWAAAFTPDGSHILYSTDVGGDSRGTLRLASLADGSTIKLADHAADYGWVFAPDGKHVAFDLQEQGGPRILAVAPLDGSAPATPLHDALLSQPAFNAGGVLLSARAGSAAPYRFQDGFYTITPR